MTAALQIEPGNAGGYDEEGFKRLIAITQKQLPSGGASPVPTHYISILYTIQ